MILQNITAFLLCRGGLEYTDCIPWREVRPPPHTHKSGFWYDAKLHLLDIHLKTP